MEARLSPADRIGAAALLLVPALSAGTYFVTAGWTYPLSGARIWLLTWAVSGAIGAALAAAGYGPRRSVGMALMLVPVVLGVLGFLNTFEALITRGTVAPPRSPYRLSNQFSRAILIDIGYMGTGFLVWSGWLPQHSIREIAARLRDTMHRIAGQPEARSALHGYAWFPLLLGGAALSEWVINNHVPAIITGDDSRVWSRMTPYHAVMLAAAAAVTEELLYRLLLLGGTARLLHRRIGTTPALAVGMVVQTLVFGMTHGGYGDLQIVVQATTFAVLAGLAAIFLGIWAAIVLHFLIDFFVFGSYVAAGSDAMLVALWILLAVNVAVAVGVVAKAWLRRRPGPSA